ncbi:hypothetical protein ebA244 [Aromatoleum aromaticum EbN1]|uniref:Uncharacterized protein n=1 Tax=Aromatoleum aromaticum (strain DSM 19018 / LMG 30748 / EbN1) TaxID=76114 RepID=Q5P8V7_AROAE|nr:hypothetical protein ebA244 [Aromatoleum aromaticum EbN1]
MHRPLSGANQLSKVPWPDDHAGSTLVPSTQSKTALIAAIPHDTYRAVSGCSGHHRQRDAGRGRRLISNRFR